MKRCSRCKAEKPPEAFCINRRMKDGRHITCKNCINNKNSSPQRQKKVTPSTRPEVCVEDGCRTRLSRYGFFDRCSLHELPEDPEDISKELTRLAQKHRAKMKRLPYPVRSDY
jgi:hypothetical protein